MNSRPQMPEEQNRPAIQEKVESNIAQPSRVYLFRFFPFLVLGIFALLLAFALLLRWMVDVEQYRPQIITFLESLTDRPVSLSAVALSPTGGFFTLELRDLVIHALNRSEPPVVRVKALRVGMTPLSFFYEKTKNETGSWPSRLDISSLTLVRPELHIIQRGLTPLMRQAQDTAKQSDKQMEQELGLGLTDISIGSVTIQSGTITLVDETDPQNHALVWDQIQAGIHSLSPNKASPVSASALFQSIPFTVNGQIGPLPKSLDPAELPVLLSLEAKSAQLPQLTNLFTNISNATHYGLHVRGTRGYFSTLFHGSLRKGMLTTSRLEVDKLEVDTTSGKIHKDAEGNAKETQSQEIQTPVSWTTITTGKPLDWAIRQKSLLRLEDQNLSFQIKESFLYLEREPVLDVKGVFDRGKEILLNLRLVALKPIRLEQFPHPFIPFPAGGSVKGELQIHGSWPDSIALSTNLDLTNTEFSSFSLSPTLPKNLDAERPVFDKIIQLLRKIGIKKQSGTPLFLTINSVSESASQGKSEENERSLILENVTLSRSSTLFSSEPAHRIRLSGTLLPKVRLSLIGEWELSLLKELLPKADAWDLSGLAQTQVSLTTKPKNMGGLPELEGYLRSDKGQLGGVPFEDFFTRIKLSENLLRFSGIEIQAAEGRLDGHLLADFSQPHAFSYHGLFSFAGIAVERWMDKFYKDAIHVEGLAFGQGDIRGSLDDDFFPEEPFSGIIHLEIEPGRITGMSGAGIDGDLFLRSPVDAQVIFNHKKTDRNMRNTQEKATPDQPVPLKLKTQENLANPKKAFYWNRMETDILLHNASLYFDHLKLYSAGLTIFGNGEWLLSGKHWFNLDVYPSLKKGLDTHFSAWVEGDDQTTIYYPNKRPSPTNSPE